jgi:predicted dehydrogenase|tara:strand:+ start:1514 stop:2536 length:1023 start_codon:yes stop_codon:yes gene_type:complete
MNTKVAIVGSGFGMYGLLPAFSRIKECKVVSICGKNSEMMLNNCKKLGLNRYTDWREMLQKEKPDAVAIAVIPSHQYEIAIYALENGMAVFAEKPLTTSFDTSLELNKLAKKKRLPNMLDFLFPEIPEWHAAKKAIENGLIGEILKVNVDWTFLSYDLMNHIKSWKTDVKQGGGALSFYFSHVFYYLEYFLGRIKNIECNFSSSEKSLNKGETGTDMTISFENGCVGNAHMDISNTDQQKHKVEFHAEGKTIILQNFNSNFVDNFELILNTSKGIEKIKPDMLLDSSYDESEDPRVKVIKPIAERFINWCNTGNTAKPDFEDGLRVQELIKMARISNSNF